jgi:hypothetical protein
MTSTTTRRPRLAAAAGTRKSPLRTATLAVPADDLPGPSAADILLAAGRGPRDPVPAPELRQMQISEFAAWLQTRTNRNRRPFQEATVAAYTDAARSLDRWMTDEGIDGDFTACDTAMLNRFFTGWVTAHGQAGLNTRQRNLRHLFTWLEEAYGHPHPYTAALHRYAPLKKRPSTLAQEFIADLLEVTGGGRARGFEEARDHAMIRMLTEGVRRMGAHPAGTAGSVRGPHCPAVRPRRAAEERPRLHRGPHRAADGRDLPVRGGLPAHPPLAPSRAGVPGAVAGYPQPWPADRLRPVRDAQAPRPDLAAAGPGSGQSADRVTVAARSADVTSLYPRLDSRT